MLPSTYLPTLGFFLPNLKFEMKTVLVLGCILSPPPWLNVSFLLHAGLYHSSWLSGEAKAERRKSFLRPIFWTWGGDGRVKPKKSWGAFQRSWKANKEKMYVSSGEIVTQVSTGTMGFWIRSVDSQGTHLDKVCELPAWFERSRRQSWNFLLEEDLTPRDLLPAFPLRSNSRHCHPHWALLLSYSPSSCRPPLSWWFVFSSPSTPKVVNVYFYIFSFGSTSCIDSWPFSNHSAHCY